ncbi:olfactory receptor 1F1-like [Brachyhypopomus gauderio]|uniref:olfactory receptor 1F1-like n=1 Tax=Brachyhypopomus gauderio TaxID=698409 RepID=UPI0040437472
MSVNSASAMNATIIRPDVFFISGFYNVPHSTHYYIFLGFVYIVTVLGNSAVMCTIYLARSLHTAKYVAVFNLAFSDLCGSSALIPKLLDTFLFNNQYISYGACLANMFFVYLFMTLQSLTLVALAYDRVIAICFPLRYHVILTKTSMAINISVIWIISVFIVTLTVALITRLSFCSSITITSYFCDHGPVYMLSCSDQYWNDIMACICFYGLICTPVIVIIISYVCIGTALLKISKWTERIKAMKTCIAHLIVVAVFYLPILSTNVAAMISSINQNDRIINSTLTQTIPPLLNPIIYTLKTEEFKQAIKGICRRVKVNVIAERHKFRQRTQRPNETEVREVVVNEPTVLYMNNAVQDKILCTVQVTVNGQCETVELIVDTGSSVSIIPENIYYDCFPGLPGVQAYLDDVICYGTTQEEHDENLWRVLQALTDAGLKLNMHKCKFNQLSHYFEGRTAIGPGQSHCRNSGPGST